MSPCHGLTPRKLDDLIVAAGLAQRFELPLLLDVGPERERVVDAKELPKRDGELERTREQTNVNQLQMDAF